MSSQRRMLRALAALAGGVGLIAGAALGATAASAAPPYATTATITSLTFDEKTVASGSTTSLSGTWSLPDNAATPAGFAVDLPAGLQGRTDSFSLLDPKGVAGPSPSPRRRPRSSMRPQARHRGTAAPAALAEPETRLTDCAAAATHPDTDSHAAADSEPHAHPEPEAVKPTIVLDTAAGPQFYPRVTGTGEPGATIDVIDESGTAWRTVMVDPDGTWWTDPQAASACVIDPSEQPAPGSHTLAARQRTSDGAEQLSDPVAFDVADPPIVLSPTPGETMSANDVLIQLQGIAGASVQRALAEDSQPCRDDLLTLDATGAYAGTFQTTTTGTITVSFRYVDPASGRFGAATFVTFTVQ